MMRAEEHLAGVVDYKMGVHRFADNEALYLKFLKKFDEDKTFPQLKQVLEVGNYADAFFYAHTLKGVAGNLSLTSLAAMIEPIVEALRDEADIPFAEAAFPKLEAEYERVVALIRQLEQ